MRSISALCCLFLFAVATAAQHKPVDFAELEKTVAAELRENNTPGAAVVVISGERVLFMKGFGTTSAEGGAPVTPGTLFRRRPSRRDQFAAIVDGDRSYRLTLKFSEGRKMKKRLVLSILLTLLASVGQAATPAVNTTAFVGVNVIPMDRERVLSNQTVIVRDGVIVEIGDAKKVRVPGDAQRIDGRGKFLIPGLTDMHVHLFTDDEFPDALAEDEFKIMLAQGVTTIRLMNGTPEQLVLRARSAKGEIVAPTIYAASPQFIGRKSNHAYVVTNEAEARAAVRKAKTDGYDYLKMTTFLKPEVYEAIIEEAARQNIRVVGHADSRTVGLPRALKARQQIEHLDSYLEALLPENSPVKGSVSDLYIYQPKNWESLDVLDEKRIPEIARATVQANPFSVPTLHLFKSTFGIGRTEESIRLQPDIRFYPQKTVDLWVGYNKKYQAQWASPERRARYVSIRNKLVKAIHDAGGKILAGSDTPEWLLLYGYTLHRELRALNEAGLSPYATLAAATRNPAEFFGTLDKTGTIERGKRADLVLLEANPLAGIANTERRAGVMLKGRWFAQAELDKTLDEIAPRFQHALEEKH
ncbi:MAG TPA: amidohydrolase family protein [Pyrinomonadaceae bacterium]